MNRMKRLSRPVTGTLLLSMALGGPVAAQLVPAPPPVIATSPTNRPALAIPGPAPVEKTVLLSFKDAPLDQVLDQIAEWTKRTIIKQPGLNVQITIKSEERLKVSEAMQALETVLAMNKVGLVKMGDRFLKVVTIDAARGESLGLGLNMPDKPFAEADQLVSQVIGLKFMETTEVTPVIQGLLHGYGKIQPLERTNALLITDTAANINRVLEMLAYLDQPIESKVDTKWYQINYAKASELASRLNELIAESQSKEEKPRIQGGVTAPAPVVPSPPGVIRAVRPETAQVLDTGESAAEAAERGIIRGKVKIISDDRRNILFIISRLENFKFFENVIKLLDQPVEPDTTVDVVSLEFAKADEMASVLNEFIGAASSDKSGQTTSPSVTPARGTTTDTRGQALRDFAARATTTTPAAPAAERTRLPPVTDADKNAIGRLSPNTRILADKRTNKLLMMGRPSDLDSLKKIVSSLDVMLAQVLIEAVIIEVNLGKDLNYGVDWLQRSMTAYNETRSGAAGGLSVRQPIFSFGGNTGNGNSGLLGSASSGFVDSANGIDSKLPISGSGLSYYLTMYDLNLDTVIRMASSSSDARILSTPVILTTDNTEAMINIGEDRPIVTGSTRYNTTDVASSSTYEYKTIGIKLTVTPRINPNRVVMMEVKQTADNVGGFETIDNNRVPVITKREMQAQVAIGNRQTVVLGGLVSTDKTKTRTGVPLLKDIPLLGWFFRSDALTDKRTELIVLLTPYVLTTPQEAMEETVRLHRYSGASRTQWHEGWSDSPLPRMSQKELDALLLKRNATPTQEVNVKRLFGSLLSTNTPVIIEDSPTNAAPVVPPVAVPEPKAVVPDFSSVVPATPVAPTNTPPANAVPAVAPVVQAPVAPPAVPVAPVAPVIPAAPVVAPAAPATNAAPVAPVVAPPAPIQARVIEAEAPKTVPAVRPPVLPVPVVPKVTPDLNAPVPR